MPTTRPRHTVTETAPVQQALNELRAEMPDEAGIDFAELVILGAHLKARRLREHQQAGSDAAKRLATMIRDRSMPFAVDLDAATQVKRLGLIDRPQ